MERNIQEEILGLIRSGAFNELEDYHDNDIASVLDDLSKEERIKLYQALGKQRVSDIFSYLEEDVNEFIEEIGIDKAADIIELMDADDAIDVLEELDDDLSEAIINELEEESRTDIETITKYEDNEVGSLMTTNFISFPKTLTVKQAMRALISNAGEKDNINMLFTENEDGTYYGVIDLRDLIIARSDKPLDDIIKTSYPHLNTHDIISEVINDAVDYQMDIIPVLDTKNVLIGVITSSDLTETVEDELTDDYAKLAGLSEDATGEGIGSSVKKRITWLVILLGLGLVVSMLISGFEDVVKTLPMLIFFQSLILDMAGNSGTQSLAVTIRSISEDVEEKKRHMVLKEALIGLVNGLILSLLSFALVFGFLFITKTEVVMGQGFALGDCFKASICVSCALLGAMVTSSMTGCLVPIFFKLVKVDPAVASGPFITTINDVVSVVIYYGLAYLLFFIFL